MRSDVIKKLVVILAVVLILASVPTTVIASVDEAPEAREREAPSDEDLEKCLKESLKLLEKAKRVMEKQIKESIKRLGKAPTKTDTVTLGTDKTFYDADTWDKGKSKWGVCAPMVVNSGYDYKAAFGTTYLGPGVGSGEAWAFAGKEFYVSGAGSETANIIVDGYYRGYTGALLAGSATTKITFHVLDTTTGADYDTTIYEKSASGAGSYYVDKDFVKGKTVLLKAGHTYVAYVQVETAASVAVYGSALSNFGPYLLDDYELWYFSIEIDF